jgi:hypothetical protein
VTVSNIQEIVESAKLKRSKEALSAMNTVTASVSGENLLLQSQCKLQSESFQELASYVKGKY